MTTLYRRKDSPYWYVQFKDPRTGQYRRISTGCRTKAEAEIFVQRMLTMLRGELPGVHGAILTGRPRSVAPRYPCSPGPSVSIKPRPADGTSRRVHPVHPRQRVGAWPHRIQNILHFGNKLLRRRPKFLYNMIPISRPSGGSARNRAAILQKVTVKECRY